MALDSSICAGDLTHRLQLQRKTESQSASGAMVPSWVSVGTPVWGRLKPLAGHELLAAQQLSAKLDSKAVIRYRSDVTANMRILFRGVPYDIGSVAPDERFADHLTLLLSSGLNTG